MATYSDVVAGNLQNPPESHSGASPEEEENDGATTPPRRQDSPQLDESMGGEDAREHHLRANESQNVPPSPTANRRVTVDERNTLSFRVPHRTTSSSRTPQRPTSTMQQAHTQHQLLARLKAVISDAVMYVSGHPHDDNAANLFISVADDGLRSLKSAKVENRSVRRAAAAAKQSLLSGEASGDMTDLGASTNGHHSTSPNGGVEISPSKARLSARLPPSNKHVDPEASAAFRGAPAQRSTTPRTPRAAMAGSMNLENSARPTNAWAKPLIPKDSPQGPGGRDPAQVVEERLRDAAKAAERQSEAEARRRLIAAERQQRLEERADRVEEARARREAAEQKQRLENEVRAERATQQRTKEVERRRENAAKETAKVDEASFITAAEAENRAALLDERLRASERATNSLQQQRNALARERADQREAVVSRARSAERQKLEERTTKVQAKEDQRLRHEAERRKDQEEKVMRHEERRGRVQEQQQAQAAEAEARATKASERLEKSEKVREELVKQLKERSEKQEAKLKEARERRETKEASRGKLADLLAPMTPEEKQESDAKLNRIRNLSERHAKPYLEEASLPPSSLKSKVRAIMGRVNATIATPAQCRQPLADLLNVLDANCASSDVAALRIPSAIPLLVESFYRSRCSELPTLRSLCEVLVRFVTVVPEREKNVEFFLRAGCIGRVLDVLAEELSRANRQSSSLQLTTALTLLYACCDFVFSEARDKPELQAFRVAMYEAVDALGLYKYALALAMVAAAEDMPSLQAALAVLRCHFVARPPKRTDKDAEATMAGGAAAKFRHDQMFHNLMTCVAHILMPNGQPVKADAVLPPAASGVMFLALRLLNDVARRDLLLTQTMIAETASSTVFKHVVTSVCTFIANHTAELEAIPPCTTLDPTDRGQSSTFTDALRAGVAHNRFPVPELPKKKGSATFIRAAFHELLLLMGYVSINNTSVQNVFGYGTDESLLTHIVAALPVAYFGVSKHVALPSLLAICFRHKHNQNILRYETDTESLCSFLQTEMAAYGVKPLPPGTVPPPSSAPSAHPPRPVIPASWADMLDDDDDQEELVWGHPDNAAAEAAAHQQHKDDSERIAKAVTAKGASGHYASFFRMDKRFAKELWAEALLEFEAEDVDA